MSKRIPILIFFCFILISACTNHQTQHSQQATKDHQKEQTKIKNVILVIGDGMGPQQIALQMLYAGHKKRPSAFNRLMNQGTTTLIQQKPAENLVIDSACSATQMATGRPALSEVIGVDSTGEYAETILEKANKVGKSTGLVSDTRITHATPASFISHVSHRSYENDIAEQIAHSKANVLFSGGFQYFIPKSGAGLGPWPANVSEAKSKRDDERHLLNEARKSGFDLAFSLSDFKKLTPEKRVLGLFTPSSMPNGIEHTATRASSSRSIPTLKEMSLKAIELLEADPDGFFLMIEGGQIDWAGHSNDAGLLLHEMERLNETLLAVMKWAESREDTLIVVTADHETGSFGLSYSSMNIPSAQKRKGEAFKDHEYHPHLNFASPSTLDRLYAQKAPLKNLVIEAQKNKLSNLQFKKVVQETTGIELTDEEAMKALEVEDNHYHIEGHKELKVKSWSKIADFDAFYPYEDDRSSAALGRQLGRYQNVVWGTGTHTTTLIPAFILGPKSEREKFSASMQGHELGAQMIKALGLSL